MLVTAASQAAEDIRAPGAKLEAAATVAFTEGPVYSGDGSIYFSDIANNRIMRFLPGAKAGASGSTPEVFRYPSGRANGLAFDLEGRLLACEGGEEGGNRRVTRTEKDGRITVLADHYQGKRLNSPNDLDIDAQGRIYFTDPRYGDRADMELDKECVYRIDPDGTLTRIIEDMERPNGIAVSADQKTLYVIDNNNSRPGGSRKVYAYELRTDGSTGSRRVVHDFATGRGGDGMCLDTGGNLYIAAGLNAPAPPAEDGSVKAGVYIFSTAGKQLGFIPVPEDVVTNVAFGDPDLKTLYITAGKTLFRIRLNVRGFVLWPAAKE
jgi:gluconolactonase